MVHSCVHNNILSAQTVTRLHFTYAIISGNMAYNSLCWNLDSLFLVHNISNATHRPHTQQTGVLQRNLRHYHIVYYGNLPVIQHRHQRPPVSNRQVSYGAYHSDLCCQLFRVGLQNRLLVEPVVQNEKE